MESQQENRKLNFNFALRMRWCD